MKALRDEFPGRTLVQVRLIYPNGSRLEVEGPVTEDEARIISSAAIGRARIGGEWRYG
jgi:hypothetical protein